MKRSSWFWIIGSVVILGGLIGWRVNQRAEAAQAPGGAGAAGASRGGGGGAGGAARRTPTVETYTAAAATLSDALEAPATVESPYRVQLSPRSAGRIEFLQAREGDGVTKGQVLVRIDPSQAEAAVLQAEAAVAEARSRLAQARLQQGPAAANVAGQIEQQQAGVSSANAALNQVQRNFDAQVATAQAQVTDATSRARAAEAQVNNALAVLGREQASLENARTRLGRTESLYRQGFIAAQEVDDARTAVEVQANTVKVAQAQVEAARQSLESAQAQVKVASNQLIIVRRTGQADIAAARAEAAQARSSLKVAQANTAQNPAYQENLAALAASVRAAEAQLRQARANRAETVLRSPIAGTVTERSADPGALATPGQPVLVVQYLDWLFVTSSLPIEASATVREGTPVEIRINGLGNRVFTGRITNVNRAADPASRQFGVRVKLQNPGQLLRPGMFGTLRIATQQVQAAVAVPKEAVQTQGAQSTVTVIGEDRKAEVRPVRVGVTDGRLVQIVDGLQAGEKVSVLSFSPLREGQTVQLPGDRPAGARNGQSSRSGDQR